MRLYVLLFFLFFVGLSSFAQRRPKASAGKVYRYSLVDNNLANVPNVFFGFTPVDLNLSEAISFKIGAYASYRINGLGEVRIKYGRMGGSRAGSLPPFNENKDCYVCPDNGANRQREMELGFTWNFSNSIAEDEYKVTVATSTGVGNTRINYYVPVQGDVLTSYGLRLGAIHHDMSYYQATASNAYLTYGFVRPQIYLGVSKSSIGKMIINHEKYGLRGSGYFSTTYFDILYAPNQTIISERNPNFPKDYAPEDKKVNLFPLGFRLGYEVMSSRKKAGFASQIQLEIGVRPTYFYWYREAYLCLKFGLGGGFGQSSLDRINRADVDESTEKNRVIKSNTKPPKPAKTLKNYKKNRYKPTKPAHRFG